MNQRIRRVVDELKRRNLRALVCGRPSNVLALTGYWPVVGISIVVLTCEGITGLLVPEDELHLVGGSAAGKVASFEPASLMDVTPANDTISWRLRELAASIWCTTGSCAHDAGGGTEPATYAAQHHFGTSLPYIIQSAFGSCDMVDASEFLDTVRAVLTDNELEAIKQACGAAERGFTSAVRQVHPGITEREAARIISSAIASAHDVPRSESFGFCMSGPNSADSYRAYQWTGTRTLKDGDIVLLHVNSVVSGMWTDISRSYSMGAMSDNSQAVARAMLDAAQAAMDAVRPGARAGDVDRAARDVMARAGFGHQFKHATGHGVGFANIDHGAHPRIHPRSDEVLERGMVFNIEPAAYFPGEFGMRHCTMVAVTGGGHELLTPFHSSMDDLILRGA